MNKSLFSRYFTVCASLILLSITLLGVMLLVFSSQYFRNDKLSLLQKNAEYAINLTIQSYKDSGNLLIRERDVLPGYMILADAIDSEIYLSDMSGVTKICTHRRPCNHSVHVVDQAVLQEAVSKGIYTEIGKMNGIYAEQYYTVGIPLILNDNIPSGVLFISTSAASLTNFLSEIMQIFLLSALAVVLMAFVIIYFITSNMVKPLRQMVAATKSFSKGDFTTRIPVNDMDEIGQLSLAFNTMASNLATLESVRRSFVANVSHELKTPMTTIAGFIDGILDGTIPPEKQRHYLGIVSDEVKRLSRLVKSMLNIARIEAGEQSINPTQFDINEIVCRTIFTFEKATEDKHLEIRGLDVDKIMVEADVDLIHQVVYNLVENAVKFVNDGGYIEFNYNVDGKSTYVSVRNSGPGIEKDEITKVFDRFYKTDSSRSKDKNGVGLGLHIVRSIVNLHGGDIIVRSVEGEYCEFVFSVPTATGKNPQSIFRKNIPTQ
ncbi:MAG: HAMP domain-containing sensor histidine kinase [Oscillospiraceae bacterium]